MGDDALRGLAFGGRHAPGVRRRLDQHLARRGAALADVLVRLADAAAAAGRVALPDAVAGEVLAGGRIFGRDLRPVAFELLDDELGEAGERALSHLGARDAHDDRVVGADHHPGVDLRSHGALRGGVAGERDMEAEREPGGRGGRAGEELAAGDL